VKNRNTLDRELEADLATLRDKTQTPVRWFAYPFGKPKNISVEAYQYVENLGLDAAFSYVPQSVSSAVNRYRVGRYGLELDDSPKIWERVLSGAFDRLYALKNSIEG